MSTFEITTEMKIEAPASEMITIFGYGSLMDFKSAAHTMPTARNFRQGTLSNYQRVFSLVSIGRLRAKTANEVSKEMAALSVVHKNGCVVHGVLFEIPINELDAYLEREHRYHTIEVDIIPDNNKDSATPVRAWTVVSQTDEEYRTKCGSDEEYYSRVGQYYSGILWGRTDIYPLHSYLVTVLVAAFSLGGITLLDHLLDDTLCADLTTTIRQHCLDLLLGIHSDSLLCQHSLLKGLLGTTCLVPIACSADTTIAQKFSLAQYLLRELEDVSP